MDPDGDYRENDSGVAASAADADLPPSANDGVNAPSSSPAVPTARRVHGTHYGSSATDVGNGHHFSTQGAQRLSVVAVSASAASAFAAAESTGGGVVGRGPMRSSTRVKVDRATASGEGGCGGSSTRVVRAGGGAAARRTRHGKSTVATTPGGADFATDGAGDDRASGGGGNVDGTTSWNSSSAVRISSNGVSGGGGGNGDNAAVSAKPGAFRVLRGGTAAAVASSVGANERNHGSGSAGGASGSGDPPHQRSPAARVVARRPSVVAPTSAAGAEGEHQGLGGSGVLGGAPKVGRGVQPARVVGRHQQQRSDAGAGAGSIGRRRDEAGGRGVVEGVAVAASVILDRRDVLRQVNEDSWCSR